jgi:hypothetical protein
MSDAILLRWHRPSAILTTGPFWFMPRHAYAMQILHQLHRLLVLTDRPREMKANAAVPESAIGTLRTCRNDLTTSVLGGTSDSRRCLRKKAHGATWASKSTRHGGTRCDPKQRCGNSLALSWIACSLVLVAPHFRSGALIRRLGRQSNA